MLYHLLYPLKDLFIGFNLFKYITFRTAYATLTSLLLTFFIAPKVIQWARKKKFGEVIRDDGPKHHHIKKGTPTMGGIMILLSTLFSVFFWARFDNAYIWLFIITTILFGILGFIDDYIKVVKTKKKGIRMRVKLGGEIIISLIVVLIFYFLIKFQYNTFLFLPFIKNAVFNLGAFYIIFGVIIMVGASNAVNMTDGLDGLAIGCSLMTLSAFTVLAYLSSHIKIAQYLMIPHIPQAGELTVFGGALIGASLGFLWYNSHPAEIFMGDTGALTLGGIIGLFAVTLKKEILLLILGGIFVIETMSVIIQVVVFKISKKRVFKMAPLHHHFELKGIPESKIIIRFWIIALILTLIGLSTLKIQ
ncbi:MAG: phospho-N-acetylmuramoyl-pentapeptide-transferase [Spirochaetes bacterium]|nr:phospho-N-acetylmuramoyl-pentapeptide-transferase [Spirochaetota bacterium]